MRAFSFAVEAAIKAAELPGCEAQVARSAEEPGTDRRAVSVRSDRERRCKAQSAQRCGSIQGQRLGAPVGWHVKVVSFTSKLVVATIV